MVRSVERAGRLLEALYLAPDGRRLVDLSRDLGLHKTTVLRLLRTLVATNLVRRDPSTDRYSWDPIRWYSIAFRFRDALARANSIQQVLQEAADAIGETVVVTSPDVERRRMILGAWAEPRTAVHADVSGVSVLPMNASAAGKVFLSLLDDAALAKWLRGEFPMVTPHTVADPRRLLDAVHVARRQGYAVSREEAVPGLSAVAVVLTDNSGQATGGLSVVMPKDHLAQHELASIVSRLRSTADQVSALLYSVDWEGTQGDPEDGTGGGAGGTGMKRRGQPGPWLQGPYRFI